MVTRSTTRERLLDAAEAHFSEHGYAGTSLRTLTAAAQANLAAAHYHFGSKEDLFAAVVARRLEPINRERLQLLDEAEARDRGRGPSIEAILHAVIAPVLRAGSTGPWVLRLVGRASAESSVAARRVAEGPLREVRARVLSAMRRALPRLSERDICYRMHFCMGVVKSVASDQHLLRAMSHGRCDPDDLDETLAQLIPFLAAALRAPAPRRSATKARGGRA
jgi:AcrR family transcriptional regulator